jgi:hypothetical protein
MDEPSNQESESWKIHTIAARVTYTMPIGHPTAIIYN